jgi:hypothetical protein
MHIKANNHVKSDGIKLRVASLYATGYANRYAHMTMNRYLPNWLHRVANAIFATALCAAAGIAGFNYLHGIPVLARVSKWLLYLSPFVGIFCGILNPQRFSLTEGLAGEVGYDGLDSGICQ